MKETPIYMNKFTKRTGIVAASIGGVASIAIASFAFFTATATVVADGTTDTVEALTVSNATVSAGLSPGNCSDVTFTLANPNPETVHGVWRINSSSVRAGGDVAQYLDLASFLDAGTTAQTSTVLQNAYKGIDYGNTAQYVFPNALCMSITAPDTAQGVAVAVDLNVSLKQKVGTEYTG